MPKYYGKRTGMVAPYKKKRRMRRMRGRGKFIDWAKRVNKSLRKSKLLSQLGSAYGSTGLPGSAQIGTAAGIAEKLGYGRRRRGYGLRLAGKRKCPKSCHRRRR